MSFWLPTLSRRSGPRYLAIVESLAADVASGRLKAGSQLLPQRDMADRLGLSIGTISKAYAEAERRGLISGEVGRGTFVLRQPNDHAPPGARPMINLSLNVPPPTGEDKVVGKTLAAIAAGAPLDDLLGYLPHQGLAAHREAIAGWLGTMNVKVDADRVFVTHGAQHAISLALGMIAARGDVVLAETLTYSGMLALAAQTGCQLRGVAMDEEGLVPEALDRAFKESGARVLYAMPTLQTPTAVTMPRARRAAIADIVRQHDAYLIEDDAYVFLPAKTPPPISLLIPERSFYAVSFAKCLAPGLRVGAMIAPDSFRDRAINGLRATGWMAAPLMVEAVTRMIRNGDLDQQVSAKRKRSAAWTAIARGILGDFLADRGEPHAFHLWLRLPRGRTVTALITQAAIAGVTLAPPIALQPLDPASAGVRLCLGAIRAEPQLEGVLRTLRGILEATEVSFV